MDINNAFDEILKIQDKLDKTNDVNPKITVDGKECTLYHTGNKPSANDVGANTTLFSGYLEGATISNSSDSSAMTISSSEINKNTCFSGDYFIAPKTGCYLFTGYYAINNTSITKNGNARLWIQIETSTGTYVNGAAAINMSIENNVYKNYNFSRHLYIEKGQRVKFYHNVDNGATYTFGNSDLTIIKLN